MERQSPPLSLAFCGVRVWGHCTMKQVVGQKLLCHSWVGGQGSRLLLFGWLLEFVAVAGALTWGLPWLIHGCNVWTQHEYDWGGMGETMSRRPG